MLLIHGVIHTMEDETYADGFVQVNGDKIQDVGDMARFSGSVGF